MDRQQLFNHMAIARAFTIETLSDLTATQWTSIPEGFSNNILWNAGHIATSQARLLYRLSGLPLPLPANIAEMTLRDTSPKEWTTPLDPKEVLDALGRLVHQAIEDDAAGKFAQFTPTEVRSFPSLDSFDDAIVFAILHEGIHIGTIMQLRKLVE